MACRGSGARGQALGGGGPEDREKRQEQQPPPAQQQPQQPPPAQQQPPTQQPQPFRNDNRQQQFSTKRVLEGGPSEIGWTASGTAKGAEATGRKTAAGRGDSGDGGALSGTNTETRRTEVSGLAGTATATQREIRGIESPAERRRRPGPRRRPRGPTGPPSRPRPRRGAQTQSRTSPRGRLSRRLPRLLKRARRGYLTRRPREGPLSGRGPLAGRPPGTDARWGTVYRCCIILAPAGSPW